MIPASVFIITLNEQEHLGRALESVQDFAECIVVDCGSTDQTLAIAQQWGAKVVHQEWLGFAAQKAFALAQCKQDYVVNLDADEALTEGSRQAISKFITTGKAQALSLCRREVFLGKATPVSVRMRRLVRVAQRESCHYDPQQKVHESLHVQGIVANSNEWFEHHGETSLAIKLEKNNRYTSLRAQELYQAGTKPSRTKLITVLPIHFLRTYLIRRECFNGWRGFVNSACAGYFAFLRQAKLFELHHRD